jgi:hypothetical protein
MTAPAPIHASGQTPRRLTRLSRVFRLSENSVLIILAILLGLASGGAAVGFHFLIEGTHLLLSQRLVVRRDHGSASWWLLGWVVWLQAC